METALREHKKPMTLQPDPSREALQAYARNRHTVPPEALQQYVGLYVAWSPDGTEVVASHETRRGLRQRLLDLGQDPHQCVVERIPRGMPWPDQSASLQ